VCGLERFGGVMLRLFGEFVPGQMILFAVMNGSRTMCMRRQVINPQTARLVTTGIQRFLGQCQPGKFFGNHPNATLGVRLRLAANPAVGDLITDIERRERQRFAHFVPCCAVIHFRRTSHILPHLLLFPSDLITPICPYRLILDYSL
jgi:hypothetical protein